jgi:hypothetical protein
MHMHTCTHKHTLSSYFCAVRNKRSPSTQQLIRLSAHGWDHAVQGLVQLGLLLLDANKPDK